MQSNYNVFISYRGSSSGGLLGKEIYTDLKNAPTTKGQPEIRPFFAPACIPKGENFKDAIHSVINNVSCVILILSKGFFEKCAENDDMVLFELKDAMKNPAITFIPVIMEGFSFEKELSLIADLFSEEEISRFKHINAINHHGIYDFNTEDDVLPIVLKALGSTGTNQFTQSVNTPNAKPKNNKQALTVAASVAAALLCIILIITIFNGVFADDEATQSSSKTSDTTATSDYKENNDESFEAQSGNQSESNTPNSSEVATSSIITNNDKNQIPEKYNSQVDTLKNSNQLALFNSTLRVKVGEYITPMAASAWKQVNIYSQNTAIAVGEGLMVKGVSKGETYIIVESYLGSTSAYYVIVE